MDRQLWVLLEVALLGVALTWSACTPEPLVEGDADQDMVDMNATFDVDMDAARMNPFATDSQAAVTGQMLYAANGCAGCHGMNGDDGAFAAQGGDLVVSAKEDSDAVIFDAIKLGRTATAMQAYSMLTDDEIWQIVTHIQGWK